MLNIEKYKDEIIDEWRESEESDLLEDIKCVAHRHGSKDFTCESLMGWLCEECQETLLENEEKEFLQDMREWYVFNRLKINGSEMSFYDGFCEDLCYYKGTISIPLSSENEGFYMFQNLEDGKMYTLEELGL